MDIDENIDGIVINFPAIVKSSVDKDGRRLVSAEVSNEIRDGEGDVILQKALLDSADSFLQKGHIDLDHLSEVGLKHGIKDPSSFIIGKPVAVDDLGDKRTGVTAEITRSPDGIHNPAKNRYDAFWDTFSATPPIQWRTSVYGFPKAGQIIDCSKNECDGGAWRYLIKGLDWKSLAFTRNPVNDSIKGYAQIVTAKAFMADFAKGMPFGDALYQDLPFAPPRATGAGMAPPRNMLDAIGQYHGHIKRSCVQAAGINSTVGFRDHFEQCCGMPRDEAEVFGHALMHHILLDRRRAL